MTQESDFGNPVVINIEDGAAITRRDFFAAHAMNALIKSLYCEQPMKIDYILNEAVFVADSLISKLDNVDQF